MENKTEIKDKSIVNNFFVVGIGVFINMALGLLTSPIITRIVSPADYGRLTIFNSYGFILLSIAFLGLDAALIRFFYDYKDNSNKRNLLVMCVVLPILMAIALFGVIFLLLKFNILHLSISKSYIYLLLLFVVTSIFNTCSINLLRLTYNSKIYSVCTIVQKIIYCVIIVASVFFKVDDYVAIIVLANIISLIISTFIAIKVTKEFWIIKKANVVSNANEILKYSLPLTIFNVLYSIFDSLDKLLVDRFCSETEVGIYSSALTIVGVILLIKTTFDAIWYPAQTDHFTNDSEAKTFIQKGNKYITILMFFVGINVIMFKDVLCLLLGKSFRDASQIIPFLVMNPIMSTISLTTISGIEKSKKSYIQIIIAAICILVHYLTGIYLIPLLGLKGAAISLAISYICLFILRLYFSNKYYYIDYDFNKTIIITLITLVFAYINSYYPVSVITIVAYIVSIVILICIYKNDIKEMLVFVKESVLKK